MAAIERWHYAGGAPNTSVARHGLFYRDGQQVHGVALWLPPTMPAALKVCRDYPWTGVLSLSRFACSPVLPTNAASSLLGASMRMIDRRRWPVLLTYADTNQGHTGAIYRATNWLHDGETPAGDTWTLDGRQVSRKRGPRNLTVSELRAMGATKNPAAVKHRFVHYA